MNKSLSKVLIASTLTASLTACGGGGGGGGGNLGSPTNRAIPLTGYNSLGSGSFASISSDMFSFLTGGTRSIYLVRGTFSNSLAPALGTTVSGFTQFDLSPAASSQFPAAAVISGTSATSLAATVAAITLTSDGLTPTGTATPYVATFTNVGTTPEQIQVNTVCTAGSFGAVANLTTPIYPIGTLGSTCGNAAAGTTSDVLSVQLSVNGSTTAGPLGINAGAGCMPGTTLSPSAINTVTNLSGISGNNFIGVGTTNGNVCIYGYPGATNLGWRLITTGTTRQVYSPGSQGAVTAVQLAASSTVAGQNNGYFQTTQNGNVWRIVADAANTPQSIVNLATGGNGFPATSNFPTGKVASGPMFVDNSNTVFIGGNTNSVGLTGTKVYSLRGSNTCNPSSNPTSCNNWGTIILVQSNGSAETLPVVSITPAMNNVVTAGVGTITNGTPTVVRSYLVTAPQ